MSVAMTGEQLAQLMQTIGTRMAAEAPGPQERGGDRRTIPLKDFARMTKFAKGEENWKEWNFDFYVILGSVCPDLVTNLKVLETIVEEGDDAGADLAARDEDGQTLDELASKRGQKTLAEMIREKRDAKARARALERHTALAMGMHARLGAGSILCALPDDVLTLLAAAQAAGA